MQESFVFKNKRNQKWQSGLSTMKMKAKNCTITVKIYDPI